jgi:hypothetical protein
METLKNEWIPCPQYSFIDEEEKIEKILEDVPQNAIQIDIESTTYDKTDAYIQVILGLIYINHSCFGKKNFIRMGLFKRIS